MSGISIRYAQWGERNFVTQAKRVVLFRQLLKRVDIVSLETKAAFEAIDTVPSHKKLYLPNGFDPDFIEQFGVRRRSFADKDNIILLVGRHGDYAKNSELMLATLGDMGAVGEWQVWFVGSMTAEFEKSKDRFLEQYPQLAEKVRFTGQIDDKRQLFEMYNRSKVLCLTSRWEGFPNVAVEGLAFGLVPVMPDSIACTADIIDDGNCGICFKQDSRTSLSAALSQCIAGDGLESMAHIALQHFNRSFRWHGILKDLDERIRLQLEHTLTK
jgi:glycosyltransferase involved in cell wall biosynthesis